MRIFELLDFLEKEKLPFSFSGNRETAVEGFSSLVHYKPGSFTWIKSTENIPKHFDLSQITLAFAAETPGVSSVPNIIRSPESKRAFFHTIEHFYSQEEPRPTVGHFTYVSPGVKLGKNVRIGHNCTLDGDISIGENTVIWNNVVIVNRVRIGKNCFIHSGTIIGHDDYSYTEDSSHKKTMIKHYGGVIIGNDVWLGKNVCVNRGTIDDTVLEDGVKIDDLSQISHNCILKENATLAYPCSLGGSTCIGRNGYISGAIIRNQCTIGEDAFVGMGAVVVKNVPPGETVVGNPARPLVRKKE
ncbi:DapH/DapD/GlmU-related protein [Oscillibacter sp. 1-3]|uniref:DapH/DapD/GlmU-related protein n=1 Tax=Oscillibacter sp. 1-3 TaxID=1235797 RepID=UPI000335C878|nr:DapH/DapD/GlmU-related protein [Oscillibacter sp. 1-3]EOS66670.1 UDP-3-O-[3-hydroxymyristoyl] glucosamine N-acyltransferase [Oscillibacter sp. 1-3]